MIRFPVQPRMVPPEKVARRLGVTNAVFAEKLPALRQVGFPEPDPVLGNYCLEAVDKWIDQRAGLHRSDVAVSDPAVIAERIRRPAWAR